MEEKYKNLVLGCRKCNTEFTLDKNDLSFYEKMKVPAPHVCPDCRFKMRALFRNETTLYSGRKCDMCNKNIVTMYNPKLLYKVYCNNCYSSDNWDPNSFSKDYDFSRPFFDQLKELIIAVPKANTYLTLGNGPNINSDFSNMAGGLKNCYMVFNSGPDEECMYARGIKNCSEVVDAYFGTKTSQSYEVTNIQQSNKVVNSKNIVSCVDCYFCLDLSGCNDCFGCIGLRNQSFHFLNEPLSKEEYKAKVNEILGSYEKMENFKKEFESFALNFPRKESNNIKVIDSTGDYLYECKNVENSFEISKGENCRHLFSSKEIKDSIGTIGYGFSSELLCEVVSVGWSNKIIGSYGVDQGHDIEYSFSCFPNNSYLIGCDSMKNSKYCILNKQYSKEEYEKIREHIIKELTELGVYGLMMPPEIAPFAYNEAIGQDNMPLTKEQAIKEGFRWEDDIQKTEGRETIKSEDIPDHIQDVSDTITQEILSCIDCNRNYKITEPELLFYRKMILPIPRKCFYCRHKDRVTRRGPYKFWNRSCTKCDKSIVTNYAPDRPEIVYCEKCYQQKVY